MLVLPFCASCDVVLQPHTEVKLIQHLVQYHGVKKTADNHVKVIYKR